MDMNHSDLFGYDVNLPKDIREVFMWLCQDVAHIQRSWNFYLELFSSEDYKDVAELGMSSFLVIEEAVRTDLIMSICRISDPAKTTNRDNLSFPALAKKCSTIQDLDTLVDDLLACCEPIRKFRHKRIAHNDLSTRIDPLNNPLPGISKKEINEILGIAKEILNTVSGHYVDVEYCFDTVHKGGAKELLYWLKSGKQFQYDKRKRLANHSTT